MVVKSAPAASFKVTQSKLLFQLFIIALDDPAVFGAMDKVLERGIRRQRGKPVFCWFLLILRPLDQKPFFRMGFGSPVIAMRRTHTEGGKARGKFLPDPLPP